MRVRFFLYFLPPLSLIALPSTPQVIVGDMQGPYLQGNEWVIQSGDKTIVHWNEFSIGAEETVRFQQLGDTSAILNRVVGPNSSEILGALLSNGHVYVLNPQGVLIGPNARIESAGFIASSLDILDQDFLEQKTILFSGEGRGMVVNLGTIACERGSVALIGRVVKNEGTIQAPEGAISLGVGSEILLQLENSPHVIIRTAVTEGTLTHTGVIEALEIELKSGSSVYAQAIQCSGIVEATTVGSRNGKIILFAPESECFVDGTLIAPGGTIHVLGEQIHLHDTALLDVSGTNGGGEILIGGDYQGANPEILNAIRTFVDQDVLLKADALDTGNGGKIIVWSDDETAHYSKISIRGGPNGGDGGMAEVSGKQLAYLGFTDGGAPLGNRGTLLLDPNDIAINGSSTTGSFTGCGTPPSTYTITSGTATNNILNTALQTQLASCNVTISTVGSSGTGPNNGSITVSSGVTWSAATTLTLTAASFISITNAISSTSASTFTALSLTANGSTGSGYDGISNFGSGTITTVGGHVVLSGKGVRDLDDIGSGVSIANSITSTTGNITFQNCLGEGSETVLMDGVTIAANVTSTSGAITFSNITTATTNGIGVRITAAVNAPTITASNIQSNGGISNLGFYVGGALGGSTNTTINLAASGGGTGSQNYGIFVESTIQTGDGGTITLNGTGGGGASGTNNHGIELSGPLIVGTTTGATAIFSGTGGHGSSANDGVHLNTGSTITLNGASTLLFSNCTGGGTSEAGSSSNVGVAIPISITTSATGAKIQFENITGGGSTTGANNYGVFLSGVLSAPEISMGPGDTTHIVGGNTSGDRNRGLRVSGTLGNATTTTKLTLIALGGGSGSFETGINLEGSGIIQAAGSIAFSLTGTGSSSGLASSYGIGIAATSRITSGSDMTLIGQGYNSNAGIALEATSNASLTTTGTASIFLTANSSSIKLNSSNNPIISAAKNVTFNGPVILSTTATINTSSGNGNVSFSSTIDGTSAGSQVLTLVPGTGTIAFSGAVGGSTRLGALTIPSTCSGLTIGSNITANSFTVSGSVPTTLAGTSIINTSTVPGGISFGGSINGGFGLTANAGASTVTFSGAVGNTTPIASLAATGGTILLNATSYTTTGTQTYTGPVVLGATSSLATTNNNISFTSSINGAFALNASAGSTTLSFGGAVGNTTPLTSLTATGGAITTNSNHTTSGAMSYNGPVSASTAGTFTNTGSGGIYFSSTLTSSDIPITLTAASTTIQVVGAITTTGSGSSLNGQNFSATASGNVTLVNIFAKGGGDPLNAPANGGNVVITTSGGSVEVGSIDTSGTSGGNAGLISLQPASGFTTGSLGNIPDGRLILNGHLTGGAISLAPTGRTAPLSIASITSSLLGNDITIIGSSLTMGSLEALTVLGNLIINVSGAIAVGDVVSLDTITLTGGSLTLYERGPASLLDFLGILNESLESHIFARTTVQRTISGAQSINGIIEGFGVSSRSAFETLLIYTPDSLILNLGGMETSSLLLPLPPPLLFVMPLIIANTQMEELLPNSWHRDFFLPWQKKLWIHKKM
jgi:filamentous hemagglutinin family protein